MPALVGFLLFWLGLLGAAYPDNGVVRNFVGPGEWRANPRRAAAKQRRRARYVGYGFVVFGVVLAGVGLLA